MEIEVYEDIVRLDHQRKIYVNTFILLKVNRSRYIFPNSSYQEQ